MRNVSAHSKLPLHSPTHLSKESVVLNDSFKISHASSESPSKKDGWHAYRKIQVLGEGSYGKVYKV